MVFLKADSLMCGVALVAAIICVLIEDSAAADAGVHHAGPSSKSAGKRKRTDDEPIASGSRTKQGRKVVPDSPYYGQGEHLDLWMAATPHGKYTPPKYHVDNVNPFSEYSPADFNWDSETVSTEDKNKVRTWFMRLEEKIKNYDSRKDLYNHIYYLCKAIAEGENYSRIALNFLLGGLGGYNSTHAAGHNVAGTHMEIPFVQVIALEFLEKHDLYDIIPPDLENNLRHQNLKHLHLPEFVRPAMTTLQSKIEGGSKYPVEKGKLLKSCQDALFKQLMNGPRMHESVTLKVAQEQFKAEIMELLFTFFQLALYQAGATEDHKVRPEELQPVANIIEVSTITGLWPLLGFQEKVLHHAFFLYQGIFHLQIAVQGHQHLYATLLDRLREVYAMGLKEPDELKESAVYLATLILWQYEGTGIGIEGLLGWYPSFLMISSLLNPRIVPDEYYKPIEERLRQFLGAYKKKKINQPNVFLTIAKNMSNTKPENSENGPSMKSRSFQPVAERNRIDLSAALNERATTLPQVMKVVSILSRAIMQVALSVLLDSNAYNTAVTTFIHSAEKALEAYNGL